MKNLGRCQEISTSPLEETFQLIVGQLFLAIICYLKGYVAKDEEDMAKG